MHFCTRQGIVQTSSKAKLYNPQQYQRREGQNKYCAIPWMQAEPLTNAAPVTIQFDFDPCRAPPQWHQNECPRLPPGRKAAAVTQFSVQRHCRLSTFPKANHHGYRYRHSELNCDKRKKAFETNGSVLVFSFFITLPLIWSDCMDATIVFDLNEREHSNRCHMNWLLHSENMGE